MKTKIAGSAIKDKNVLMRMFLVVFAGIMAFAVLISWRAELISASEYVEMPVSRVKKDAQKKASTNIKKSTNNLQNELTR